MDSTTGITKPTLCRIDPDLDVLRLQIHVMLTHAHDRFLIAASTVSRIQNTHQITVSTSTIQCRLRAACMTSQRPYRRPIMTHRKRQLRLEYARTHVRWPRDVGWSRDVWNSVLFTVESRFCLSST